MTEPVIEVTSTPKSEDVAAIGNGLNAFNDEVTGYADRQALAVLARDPGTGALLGGAIGRTSLGLLFLDTFWVSASGRGEGVGAKILAAAEAEGRQRGCRSGVLYTISFQAPGFYAKYGWRVFGEVPCDPPGTSRVFMTKSL